MNDKGSQMMGDIRVKVADVTKLLDDLVIFVEDRIKTREADLDEKIKEYKILVEKQKKFEDYRESVEKRERLLEKQKKKLRVKQQALDRKEDKLQQKLQKVEELLS